MSYKNINWYSIQALVQSKFLSDKILEALWELNHDDNNGHLVGNINISRASIIERFLKKPAPKFEKDILKEPRLAFLYAKNVIKGPWEPAELTIINFKDRRPYENNWLAAEYLKFLRKINKLPYHPELFYSKDYLRKLKNKAIRQDRKEPV